tara:strand:+ start:617 stop:853 length:237 start_codon:yes stop_codon:yes gene_type:complete
MSNSAYEIEQLRVQTILITNYKTIKERKAFLEGYIACLNNEKKKLAEQHKIDIKKINDDFEAQKEEYINNYIKEGEKA